MRREKISTSFFVLLTAATGLGIPGCDRQDIGPLEVGVQVAQDTESGAYTYGEINITPEVPISIKWQNETDMRFSHSALDTALDFLRSMEGQTVSVENDYGVIEHYNVALKEEIKPLFVHVAYSDTPDIEVDPGTQVIRLNVDDEITDDLLDQNAALLLPIIKNTLDFIPRNSSQMSATDPAYELTNGILIHMHFGQFSENLSNQLYLSSRITEETYDQIWYIPYLVYKN